MSPATATTELADFSTAELDEIVTNGDASGKISGVNHMVLICRDFERSLNFYRDVLGFKLILRIPGRAADPSDRTSKFAYDSLSFFRIADNVVLGLYEIRHAAPPAASTTLEIWPNPDDHQLPQRPSGLDHISFLVPSWQDVKWFRDRLTEHEISVSPLFDLADGSGQAVFDENWPAFPSDPGTTPWFRDPRDKFNSGSIYFYDPDENALEISTADWTRD